MLWFLGSKVFLLFLNECAVLENEGGFDWFDVVVLMALSKIFVFFFACPYVPNSESSSNVAL